MHTLGGIYGEEGLLTFQNICNKYGIKKTYNVFFPLFYFLLQGLLTLHALHKLLHSAKSTSLLALAAAFLQTPGIWYNVEEVCSRSETCV